ncbi:MAG: hypothetical protein M3O15_02465 [Acidobacteriota bacterium]|nr:hypothetical protein [Acidobacteriota bacterium]
MKRQGRRLSVHRETLRNLQQADLKRADGAGNTFEDYTGCACTDTCGTAACGTAGCGSAACGTARCTFEDLTTCVC